MPTKYYKCNKCGGIVRFDGGYCENCGGEVGYRQSISNKKPKPVTEVDLNRKENMIAFKRLVSLENRVEAIEKLLRIN